MEKIAIIGAGPAGLMAAEVLAGCGHAVTIYDRMASPGRKFLLAGRGGLNLTHSEDFDFFLARYGESADWIAPMLLAFSPDQLRAWCEGLGQDVFVGSSGRVFPKMFKAAPLLRAWLRRLDDLGVRFAGHHRWCGWSESGALRFEIGDREEMITAKATLLALGGASWPRMGSDGRWLEILRDRGVNVRGLRASNCGVRIKWSAVLQSRFEGEPLKRIALSCGNARLRGEAVITRVGLEGGAVYGLSPHLRAALDAHGFARLRVDLRPDLSMEEVAARVDGDRQGRSLPNFLRKQVSLPPVAVGLVQEALHGEGTGVKLSQVIKSLPLRVDGMQPIDRAISSAGGICREELDERLMISRLPGVFAAGEMLDWEAPTGGYLLQACFSTGIAAARGIADWLETGENGVKNPCATECL